MRSARFENKAGPCKNQEGHPNGSPRTKTSKYLGMYNTGRPSNFRLGLCSPNIKCNNNCCSFNLVLRHNQINDGLHLFTCVSFKALAGAAGCVVVRTYRRDKKRAKQILSYAAVSGTVLVLYINIVLTMVCRSISM